MDTFSSLISRWETKSVLADDCRVDYGVVHQWDRRNSIPGEYWNDVVKSAQKRGVDGVSLTLLANIKSKTKH